ncbi:MAG: signal peptidase I [Chlamydiae bacterium]|nr:signal peptidase I [Chlamydiota bacterium]
MRNPFSSDTYSLKKSTTILRQTFHAFSKKRGKLPLTTKELIETNLSLLQEQILKKDKQKATPLAKQAESLSDAHLKKNQFEKIRDGSVVLVMALCAAIVIRQAWFELYEIPTGSMRPTLKEKDRLFVSKTNFGINIPLTTSHLLFDPNLAERNGIFVFTGANMDIRDVDTTYFYIFPGKKQYIKRMMGLPGDSLYFYGGQIYGMDSKGNDITSRLQPKGLEKIEHIPFIYFEGKTMVSQQTSSGMSSSVTFYQMNEPVARLSLNNQNQVKGEMLSLCASPNSCQPPVKDYSDLWGFKNFGMARILTQEEAKLLSDEILDPIDQSPYYLEIKHHPSLQSAKLSRDERGRLRPILGLSSSLLAINETHLRTIFNNLYTARFHVKNGFAYRYGASPHQIGKGSFLPRLAGVPDGTYEFYYGKAYEVLWQGITKELPPSHPLYTYSPERVQLLYNLGIEFDTRFSPQTRFNPSPSRYTYFKNEELYLMSAPIFTKEDPLLESFLAREKQKQQMQNLQYPYLPFEDNGAPLLADGSLNKDLITQNGITIPQKMYLALGDNHAMSADSRDFGFVPEDNLRGAPDWIFWPYGPRWGYPDQPTYSFFNLPRTVVWGVLAIGFGFYYVRFRRKNKLPLPISKKDNKP